MRILENLEPSRVFYYFEEISRIPRGSGNEEEVAKYIESFAKERGLYVLRDKMSNVFIKKEASKGCEAFPSVLLQGHTDMVCEKNSDTVHDFLNDPIKLVLDGDRISADGTTLGADDGIAVAMMLALLEDDAICHGPIECLFTTEEETGLGGIKAFDKNLVGAKYMINLDSEEDDAAVVSCAGGVRTDFEFNDIPLERCNSEITLTVSGLMGGHSGADIHLGRSNANKLAFELLSGIENVRLISVDGGSKDNAIPRECKILFTCDDPAEAIETVKEAAEDILSRLTEDDKGFTCSCTFRRGEFHCFGEKYSRNIITLVNSLPFGVIDMSPDLDGLVETSSNPGVIKTNKANVKIVVSSRSSVEKSLDGVISNMDSLAEFTRVSRVSHRDRYPGWEFTKDSSLQRIYANVYKELFGEEPKVYAIHAGLECGILKSAVPGLDIISTGPNAYNIHTPDESLSVSSVQKVYALLVKLLGELKD